MKHLGPSFGAARYLVALLSAVASLGTAPSLAAETSSATSGNPPAKNQAEPTRPALRAELLARFKKDQDVRTRMTEWQKNSGLIFGSLEFMKQVAPLAEEMKTVDEENCAWFKQIVDQHGWPGRTMVCHDGAGAAFILAQHADQDRPFQKRCLELMQQMPAGEVAPQNLALLTDRVLLADGRPQRYGSQVEFVDGQWQPRPVEDPEHLDERRKAVGLPPIADYLKVIAEVYGKQQASSDTE